MNDERKQGSLIRALDLGPLPAARINTVLDLNLYTAMVHFSVRAQEHVRDRHPGDFALCLRHIGRAITAPDYIGMGPHQHDGFELVVEARQDRAIILVAIKTRLDASGRYPVASTYVIDRNKLERRLRKGFLQKA